MDAREGGCGCSDSNPVTGGGVGEEAYSGVATFGRVYATIGAVIGVIIALILIFAGYQKLHDPHTAAVPALVSEANCSSLVRNGTVTHTCVVTASYVVAGKTYTASNITVSGSAPMAGSTITLRYNPANPQDVVSELPPREVGRMMIGLGFFVGAVSVGFAYLTYKSKGFAAAYGTFEGLGMVSRI